MEVDYSLLRTIHRILKQKTDLGERLEKGPRQVTIAENAERKFEEELTAVKETKTKTQMAADEKQLQLTEREGRIEELKGRLNAADSNREYQLLKDQIAADEQANLVLSDEILELLERLDTLEANVTTAEENLSSSKQETEKVRDRVNAEIESLKNDLQSVLDELTDSEAKLKGDYASEYRRQVSVRGEDALSETDMETCGQCYTRITTQMMNELLLKQPVFCKSCGSLLYISENRAAVN